MKTNIPESLIRDLREKDKTFFVAVESELSAADTLYPVIHTGMGKMNMYSALVRWWDSARCTVDPDRHVIINLGSAGAARHEIGTVLRVNTFVNGGCELIHDVIRLGQPGEPEVSIVSGDRFVSCQTMDPVEVHRLSAQYDLFDMEAYACARFCKERGLRMECFKGVSDNLDGTVKEWSRILKDLHKGFANLAAML